MDMNHEKHKKRERVRIERMSFSCFSRISWFHSSVISHEYEYTPTGNITSWTHTRPTEEPKTFAFTYDKINQLTAALQTEKDALTQDINVLKDYAYLYDKAGNRTHENIDGTGIQREYNEVNQFKNTDIPDAPVRISGKTNKETYVTIEGVPVETLSDNRFEAWLDAEPGTMNQFEIVARDDEGNKRTENYEVDVPAATPSAFAYDKDGSLTGDGTREFEWDAKNRLVKITILATGESTEFVYDSQGRRIRMIEKDEYGVVTADKRYWWLDGSTQPFEERTHDASGALVTTRRFFKRGEIEYDPSNVVVNKRFYTKDHTGSVRDLTDDTGEVVASYDYDPYGRKTTLSGNTADTVVSYTGHHWHEESGLYLTMFRQYDPELGRWLSRDPLEEEEGDGPNLYGYVLNNPIGGIDPTGLLTIVIPGYGPQNKGSNGAFVDRVTLMHPGARQFGRDQKTEMMAAIRAAKKGEEINIYGYSRGGIGAKELATMAVNAGYTVNNLILVDPVTFSGWFNKGISVPDEVLNAESHYQQTGNTLKNLFHLDNITDFPGHLTNFPGTPLDKEGPGRTNIQYTKEDGARHEDMPTQFKRKPKQ